jgi:hypothetical protein
MTIKKRIANEIKNIYIQNKKNKKKRKKERRNKKNIYKHRNKNNE